MIGLPVPLAVIESRRRTYGLENGRHYYALHGEPIAEASLIQHRPDAAALSWHNENRFRT